MLGVFKKRFKTTRSCRPIADIRAEDDEKDEPQDVAPPRFIKISDGKISLGPPVEYESVVPKDKEILEARIVELEEALLRLQDKVNNSQCGSPTLERNVQDQLENMNRVMKTKEKKVMQASRDNIVLQARFERQESLLHVMQQENRFLQQRIRQYEHCLDDVMRKVVDAIVAEDSLRDEVSMLKNRVRDLEAQNAAFSVSPAKGKDEGYCTMSSGQPQPSNGHLEDLPEEPEHWLLPAEPCSTEMEDWSMSQEELGAMPLEDEVNEHESDWIWNSSDFLNSTMIDSQSDGIAQLLQETIVYSEDEEIACKHFTKEFYKLVNIPSGSTRSLYSHMDAVTDDEDDTNSDSDRLGPASGPSPTPSEAGLAQVMSCSSSESDDHSLQPIAETVDFDEEERSVLRQKDVIVAETAKTGTASSSSSSGTGSVSQIPHVSPWRRSNGWKRIPTAITERKEIKTGIVSPLATKSPKTPSPSHHQKPPTGQKIPSPIRKSKIPPPVPIRRSYAS